VTTRWLNASQQEAWRSFYLGTAALMDRLDRELRERHDLSLPEYEVLVRLSESPNRSLRMAELAESVGNSRSRMTHTISRMEREGLVVRRSCPADRRGVLAELTDVGYQKLVDAAPDHVDSVRTALVDVLRPEELDTVGQAMQRVLAAADPDSSASPQAIGRGASDN
jgi:DNA-binding MarR family transcriptional regulator